jgi:hypothetical protein
MKKGQDKDPARFIPKFHEKSFIKVAAGSLKVNARHQQIR